VNIGCSPFIRLAILLHAVDSLGIGPLQQKQASSAYIVADVANRIASLPRSGRPEDEESLLQKAEVARSREAIEQAASVEDKALLEEVDEIQEEARMEAENARGVAASFASTLQQFMGAQQGAQSCRELACGGNGYCAVHGREGARCKCKAGYEGTGYVCNPATSFVERPLISAASGSAAPQVADLHVVSLRDNGVAVAFRDSSRQNRGFVVLGTAADDGMRWSAPALLSSSSSVFSPALVELEASGSFAVVYRTEDRGGNAVIRAGRRDTANRLQLGPPQMFARYQAQAAALLALPNQRVAVLFADHVPVKDRDGQFDHFGTSLLAEIPVMHGEPLVAPKLLGKYHFAKGAVSRITAAPISSKSFAIAFRQGPGQDFENASPSREATVSLAELWGSELVFTTQPLSLEPSREQIWARSVAGLGDGAFAYTYHSGAEQVTKQAVLRLDPSTHRLVALQEPLVLASGFTPFVSTVSTVTREAAADAAPGRGHRLFTFFGGEQGAKGQAKICAVTPGSLPDKCQEVGTTAKEVLGVSTALLSDNRVFLLTSSARGEPYYALIGL